jgi:hypothetical protein
MKATYVRPQINIIIIDPISERLGLKAVVYGFDDTACSAPDYLTADCANSNGTYPKDCTKPALNLNDEACAD